MRYANIKLLLLCTASMLALAASAQREETLIDGGWVAERSLALEVSHRPGDKAGDWYSKELYIPKTDKGRNIELQFDGIFSDAQVWFNGFFLGRESSGYTDQVYDVTPYVNFGGENVIAVRVDASMKENQGYEGGIYRHVWLRKTHPVHVTHNGTFLSSTLSPDHKYAKMCLRTLVANDTNEPQTAWLFHTLLDAKGDTIGAAYQMIYGIGAHDQAEDVFTFHVSDPHLWQLDDPHLYTLETEVIHDNETVDVYTTRTGIRSAEFNPDRGFLLNGMPVNLKGVDMPHYHSELGTAIPDTLYVNRIKELKKQGINTLRSLHHPASPAVLDACDSLGILVIDGTSQAGINEYHKRLLQRMIERDRNHPSVVLYSVDNEEWGKGPDDISNRIVEIIRDFCHQLDPTRAMTKAPQRDQTLDSIVSIVSID